MDTSGSGNLVKRLCCHVTGITDERIFEHYQLAVSLLNQDLVTDSSTDYSSICDRIKRWLVHENRLQDAVRFSFLLSKLQRSTVVKNKAAILYSFLCLRQPSSHNSSRSESEASSMLIHETGLPIVNGNDFFRAPSIQSSVSRASSESLPSSNSLGHDSDISNLRYIPNERREGFGGGRVARLAAMYRADGVKLTTEEQPLQVEFSNTTKPTPKPNHLDLKPKGKRDPQTEVSDNILLREILFAFQGIEGKVIKMDINKDCFKIDPKVRLTFGQRDLVMKLIEVGWLYSKINKFCETHGKNSASITKPFFLHDLGNLHQISSSGLVNQSLVLALREQLNEYCRLIAVLESQVHESSGNESPMGDVCSGLSLRRLLMWTIEPRSRLQSLAFITHAACDVRGGATTSAIYQLLHHGDPAHVEVIRQALSQSCQPLFVMLTEWLLDGNLQDPHHEFFIASDPSIPNEKLWHDKYDIRWCMLPSFISKAQAQKVLATGKSLNFLRNVCNYKSPISGRDSIKAALLKTTVESMFTQDETNQLEDLISLTFRTTSSHVLEEILTRHKLVDHLRALKRYLLLEQGDFIHYLMEIIEPQLCQPANRLHLHKLSSLLQNAIAASNAQFEDPEILNRLDARLLECSPGETGWDVFSLDYHVAGPIGTVFTSDCMRQYLMLFNSLWRAKHMERILSATWKQQAATSKKCRALSELNGTLHRIQLLLTEMIHLVQQMDYYMTFEVLECSWHSLMTDIQAAQSLDDIIEAHQHFLKRIVAGALLDEDSRDVRTQLRTLYELMVKLEVLQERLYNAVVAEVNLRESFEEEKKGKTAAGHFGTSHEAEEREDKRRTDFSMKVVPAIRADLKILSQSYQDMVQSFLLMLVQHNDENLHFLSSRLDFNEYYHKKDHRLNMRLTYLHKRKSMGASFCQEKPL